MFCPLWHHFIQCCKRQTFWSMHSIYVSYLNIGQTSAHELSLMSITADNLHSGNHLKRSELLPVMTRVMSDVKTLGCSRSKGQRSMLVASSEGAECTEAV